MEKHIVRLGKGYCIALFLLLFLPVLFPGRRAEASDYDIQEYHVDITVTEQNVYQVRENIKVYFNQPRHGIYRDIPLENHVGRADGSTSQVMASIRHISCGSDEFSVLRSGSSCQIKIGDKDSTITGNKAYYISYEYDMGKDVLQGADEFYYNIIGTGWSTSIRNVTFSIQMPKSFDVKKLGMVYGPDGDSATEGLEFSVEGHKILGTLDSSVVLSPGEALTVRLELPDGYFIRKDTIPWQAAAAVILSIVTMGAGFLLWNTYGKDDPVVETVEFYAPDGMNSVEAAYAYKGSLDGNDVVSLIVYLAQKGYIEIREGTGKWKKDFTLIKRKDYAENNRSEQIFMEGLFKKGDIVAKSMLENSFYKTVQSIVSQVTLKMKYKIFYAYSLNKNWILYLLLVVSSLMAGFQPIYSYLYDWTAAVICPIALVAVVVALFRILFGKKRDGQILGFIIVAAFSLISCSAMFSSVQVIFFAGSAYKLAWIFVFIAGIVTSFFSAYMSKRTPYGNEMLGKLKGFRRFLETAEKDRLEAMAAENPQYFYEILPYTYVLDVSDTWMKKFESIAVEPPEWYHSHNGTFNMVMFHRFMNSTMTSASSSMNSRPSSGGGGGSAGRGSGGGGGGSW